MTVRMEVPLIRSQDNALVMGWLVSFSQKHADDFATLWQRQLRTSADEDQYWDWNRKQRMYLQGMLKNLYEGYAIEYEQVTQGMMILQTGGYRSQVELSRRLVYVHSVATAPWNRAKGLESTGLKTVGSTLMDFARFRSEELGFGGLVGLHSLPSAEGFYRKMGLQDGGIDLSQGLRYFEWYRPRDDWWE
jgi:hypothetical protein